MEWTSECLHYCTPRTPAGQPWNAPFFRQQMQEAERLEIQNVLPPLTPFLGNPEYQFNVLDPDSGNHLGYTGLDAFPSPSDAGLIPLSMTGPVSSNPFASAGIVRNRDPDESLQEGSARNRQRLDPWFSSRCGNFTILKNARGVYELRRIPLHQINNCSFSEPIDGETKVH